MLDLEQSRLGYREEVTKEQCRAARGLLYWTVDELAGRSNIAKDTIIKFENGHRVPRRSTITLLRQAFEAAGVDFIENGSGAGVRLRGLSSRSSEQR